MVDANNSQHCTSTIKADMMLQQPTGSETDVIRATQGDTQYTKDNFNNS